MKKTRMKIRAPVISRKMENSQMSPNIGNVIDQLSYRKCHLKSMAYINLRLLIYVGNMNGRIGYLKCVDRISMW